MIKNDALDWRRGWSTRVRRTVLPIAGIGALLLFGIASFWFGLWVRMNRPDEPGGAFDPALQIRCPQIGDANGAVVVAPQGNAVIVDAGASSADARLLADQLRKSGAGKADALILTSINTNSIGGATDLIGEIPLRGPVILPCTARTFARNGGRAARAFLQTLHVLGLRAWNWRDYQQSHPGILDAGAVMRVTCLSATPGLGMRDRPQIALRVDYGSESVLYAASLSAQGEASLISEQPPLNCDVLVVPDNGSATAASSEFLVWAAPRLAVVSCAVSSPPDDAAIRRLQAAGTRVSRTDLLNGLVVEMGDEPEESIYCKPIAAATAISTVQLSPH